MVYFYTTNISPSSNTISTNMQQQAWLHETLFKGPNLTPTTHSTCQMWHTITKIQWNVKVGKRKLKFSFGWIKG